MEKVSIIVPIYNAEKTLCRCLDSIVEQSYDNIEIICINDASSDNSVEIIKEYKKKDKRIMFINNKQNKGPAVTKGIGLENATGDYISFVDSDDYIDKYMIEKMVNYAVNNKLDIVRCNYDNYVDEKLIKGIMPIETAILSKKQKNLFINFLLSGEVPAYMQLIMLNKKFLDKHNISLGDKYYLEDLLYYIKILSLTNKVGIINEPLYVYVNNNDGLTFSLSNDRILKRIDGLLFYNSEVKKIIAGKEERRIIDTRTFFLINHFMYELYKVSKNNKQLIVDTLDSSSIEKIINNVDTSAYNKFTKVGYKLILKRKYKQLFKWYNIAKLVIKVKGGK